MKYTAQSQRRRSSQSGPGISLFPFLAVLICTMGALVPLLLAISRTARLQAEAAAVAKAAEVAEKQRGELQTQQEDARWRIEQLKRSRQQTEKQLADARLELGHLEDHSRRLRQQVEQYKNTVVELERVEATDHGQKAQAEAELQQIQREIAAAQQQVAETRKTAAGRNRAYAVVPYEGPNQTRRRPIYLECRAEAIILQPEGICFTEADFEGPLGPGNPLASALRAAREHMLSQRELDPQAGEPYPLLLVRPDGVVAYHIARQAMKSWGGDFGYELIGDDWKLAFLQPDLQLASAVQQAAVVARREQAALIAAAPRHYGRRSGSGRGTGGNGNGGERGGYGGDEDRTGGSSGGYAGTETGGVPGNYAGASPAGPVGEDRAASGGVAGGGASETMSAGQPYAGHNGGYGGQPRNGGHGGATGNPYLTATSNGTGSGVGGGNGVGGAYGGQGTNGSGGVYASQAGNGGGSYAGGQTNGGTGSGDTNGDAVGAGGSKGGFSSGYSNSGYSNAGGPALVGKGTDTGNGTAGSGGTGGGAMGSGAGGERPEGCVLGQPPREREPSRVPGSESQGPGRVMKPGEWEPKPDFVPEKKPEANDLADKKNGRRPKPSIDKREEDWALRNAGRNSVGVTRPIGIECYADRLVVVSDRGPAANVVIPFGARTVVAVDPLVRAVWEQMESWDIAGRGMYWRPVLKFKVASDAEQRFNDLQRLLEGSGLLVERK